MDVLTGDGRIVTCTADNEHRDLFLGFPNSYGTLGYALRLTARTVPVKRLRRRHARAPLATPTAFFAESRDAARAARLDFLDGVVFEPRRARAVVRPLRRRRAVGRATTRTSASTTDRCASATIDYLTTRDYLWRWDTDWFWCSKNVGAQHPLLRRLLRPQAPELDHLPEDHALEHALEAHGCARTGCAACTRNR